jgi:hypothetical protein
MEVGLLAALIDVGHYRFGSRSFEKIVQSLRHPSHGLRRSNLPSDDVLDMNLEEPGELIRLLDRAVAFQRYAEVLAPAIHAQWLPGADPTNTYRRAFDALDREAREDNRAAALRIPLILALVGLELVPVSDPRPALVDFPSIIEPHLDVMAEEEHIGWASVKRQNGWTVCEPTDDPEERRRQRLVRRHDCLVDYWSLRETERERDRSSIRWYERMAALAGFKIVAKAPGHETQVTDRR